MKELMEKLNSVIALAESKLKEAASLIASNKAKQAQLDEANKALIEKEKDLAERSKKVTISSNIQAEQEKARQLTKDSEASLRELKTQRDAFVKYENQRVTELAKQQASIEAATKRNHDMAEALAKKEKELEEQKKNMKKQVISELAAKV